MQIIIFKICSTRVIPIAMRQKRILKNFLTTVYFCSILGDCFGLKRWKIIDKNNNKNRKIIDKNDKSNRKNR